MKQTSRKKNILRMVAGGVATLITAFIFLIYYDAPAPDDSDLRVEVKPVAKDDNAVPVLVKIKGLPKTNYSDFPEFADRFTQTEWSALWDKGGDAATYDIVMQKNRDAIALLWDAAKRPAIQNGPIMDTAPNYDPELHYDVLSLINTSRVLSYSWKNMRTRGKIKKAQNESLLLMAFSRRLASAEGGSLVFFLGTMAIQSMTLNGVSDSVGLYEDRESCLDVSRRLAGQEIPISVVIDAVKSEYAFVDSILRGPELEKISKQTYSPLFHYYYKRNQTRILFINAAREVIDGVATGNIPDLEKRAMDLSSDRGRLYYTLIPNSMGKIIFSTCTVGYGAAYRRLVAIQATTRQTVCAFAMRAYWLDYHKLPDSLEALVPEYMESVPSDPFGKQPMQYNPAKKVIYSAGPKHSMDDGSFAFEADAEPHGTRPFLILDWDKKQ